MMSIDLTIPEIRFALEAVHQGVAMARQVQAEIGQNQISKSDQSPVTVADFAVQALIGSMLSQSFPSDPLVGEESSEVLRRPESRELLERVTNFVQRFSKEANPSTVCQWVDLGTGKSAPRFWTVDPIDGTKGFLRGDQYVVALALIVAGKVELGVLGCPHLDVNGIAQKSGSGSVVLAARGKGAWVSPLGKFDFKPLRVSSHRDAREIAMLVSVEKSHTNMEKTDAFIQALGISQPLLAMDSQAKYAVVAAGRGDIFFYLVPDQKPNYRMKIWDVAAGALAVEEAGGRASDLEGRPLDFSRGDTLADNPGLLVTNGFFHEKALETLKSFNLRV